MKRLFGPEKKKFSLEQIKETVSRIPPEFDPLKENIDIWARAEPGWFYHVPYYPYISEFNSDLLPYLPTFKEIDQEYGERIFTFEHPIFGTIGLYIANRILEDENLEQVLLNHKKIRFDHRISLYLTYRLNITKQLSLL